MSQSVYLPLFNFCSLWILVSLFLRADRVSELRIISLSCWSYPLISSATLCLLYLRCAYPVRRWVHSKRWSLSRNYLQTEKFQKETDHVQPDKQLESLYFCANARGRYEYTSSQLWAKYKGSLCSLDFSSSQFRKGLFWIL